MFSKILLNSTLVVTLFNGILYWFGTISSISTASVFRLPSTLLSLDFTATITLGARSLFGVITLPIQLIYSFQWYPCLLSFLLLTSIVATIKTPNIKSKTCLTFLTLLLASKIIYLNSEMSAKNFINETSDCVLNEKCHNERLASIKYVINSHSLEEHGVIYKETNDKIILLNENGFSMIAKSKIVSLNLN